MEIQRAPEATYRAFINFEEKAAGIYLRLASRFASENPGLSGFWLEMAMEEKQHSVLLQFCAAENWFAPALPDESEIRKYSAKFREFEKRAVNPSLTKDEAFAMAAELEGSEVNAIYCHLTTPLHVSRYLAKKKLATAPFDHAGHLAAAARRFKVSAETIRKMDRLKDSCLTAWRNSA